jgi:hypothetical protein
MFDAVPSRGSMGKAWAWSSRSLADHFNWSVCTERRFVPFHAHVYQTAVPPPRGAGFGYQSSGRAARPYSQSQPTGLLTERLLLWALRSCVRDCGKSSPWRWHLCGAPGSAGLLVGCGCTHRTGRCTRALIAAPYPFSAAPEGPTVRRPVPVGEASGSWTPI